MQTQLDRSYFFRILPNDVSNGRHRTNGCGDVGRSGLHQSLLNIILYVNIKCDLRAQSNQHGCMRVYVLHRIISNPFASSSHTFYQIHHAHRLLERYCWHDFGIFDVHKRIRTHIKCIVLNRFVANGFQLLAANKCSSLHSKVHLIHRSDSSARR